MTLIPDNLKRTGGRPFGDGEAPNRTASKPIIADSHYTFPILSGIYKNGRALAKVWSYTKKEDIAKLKKVTPRFAQAANVRELYELIKTLSKRPNSAIVRGELTQDGIAHLEKHKFIYRRLHKTDGIEPHITDSPRKWLCFDCDELVTPYDIRTQAAQAVAYYLEQINVPKNVGYVWQLSGSAGKPDSDPFLLKAHVWLFLDEARTSKNLLNYYPKNSNALIDSAMFNPVQWHYTAAPINALIDYTDPCETRLGFVEGGAFHVPLVSNIDLSHINKTKAKRELSSKTQQAIQAANGRGLFASTFLRATAHNALERSVRELRNTKTGNRDNTLNRILYYIYGYVHAGALDENVMKARLSKAAREIGLSDDVFEDKARAKSRNYAPLDNALLSESDNVQELIQQSDKPLVVESQALWTALQSLSEYPKKLGGCLDAISTTTDPDDIVRLTAYTVNTIANNSPFRYSFDDSIKLLKETLGDKIHPLTFAACVEWGKQTGEHIKAKALKSIVISDDAKARHIYTQVAQLEDVLTQQQARVLIVRAAMGEGKTQKVGRGFRNMAERNEQRFAALTHRSALVEELCDRLKLTSYNKVQERLNEGANAKDVYSFFGSCVHSIASPLIRSAFESCDVLFGDEAAQMLRSLESIYTQQTSTARDSTAQDVYDLLVKTIQTAPKVVLCDAGANDELIEWLESILGNEKVHIVETSKKSGDGINVTFNFANQQLQGETAAITAIKARLKEGKKVWISVGTVKAGRAIAQALRGCGRGVFVHAKTPTLTKKKFLESADRESLNYDYVIASPVISCGISVEHRDGHHFDDVFFIGDGSSVVPQDVLQMIRRVRYVKDVQIYTWLPFRQRLGDTTQEKRITDFYSLKKQITANVNWERQNFVAALCHTLEGVGFNVSYQKVVPETGSTQAAIEMYQAVNDERAFTLNSAQTLSISEYESLKACSAWTQDQIDALDKYELREHLAQDWNAISTDDLKIWGEGRGRELLARRAACRGIALQGVEHSPVLCDLYGQIFEGVDIEKLETLDQATAQTIVQNAISVGRVGVQYELLPQSYARKNRQPKSAMKSALVILRQCGYEKKSSNFCTQSPNDLSNSGDSVQTSRERFTLLDRTLIEQLDAVIDRAHFRDDVLDEPTITRPLPDKVTKREFLTTPQQEETPEFDVDLSAFDNDPFFAPVKTSQQINTLDLLRYGNLVKCVDCLFLEPKDNGGHCMMEGDVFLLDTLRKCESFIIKEQCA